MTDLITEVCQTAAPRSMLVDLRRRFSRAGLTRAVDRHDTPALFDWLMPVLSYQGVSDAIAWAYMNQHGTVTFADLAEALAGIPGCVKLRSYWDFHACRFAKQAGTCSTPEHLAHCPLPQHDLRNGRLNQSAYSLFLFLRDVCDGDLVGWIDARLSPADRGNDASQTAHRRAALLEPLGCLYGVSAKVLSMALADLLLAGDPARETWVATGASIIAVDTLVHNWLHRTGCLRMLGAEHTYGPACYSAGGCAAIIEAASELIDARQFCSEGPAIFPRLVQKSIWQFCTEGALDICNGNRIDDRHCCTQCNCPLFDRCEKWCSTNNSEHEHVELVWKARRVIEGHRCMNRSPCPTQLRTFGFAPEPVVAVPERSDQKRTSDIPGQGASSVKARVKRLVAASRN